MNYGQLYKFETKLNFFTDYWRFPLDQKIPPILKRGQKLKKKKQKFLEKFFQKIRLKLTFREANYSTKNSKDSGKKVKWNANSW